MEVSIFLKVMLSLLVIITIYGIITIELGDRFKCKTIKPNKTSSFIYRIAFYLKKGSIKIHFILSDDNDEPHTHPWDFKSFLIIPYKERVYSSSQLFENEYTSCLIRHKVFSLITRKMNQYHKTTLYRIWGIKIPALTIGYYGEKKQLCSFCQTLGYCKENPPKDIVENKQDMDNRISQFDPFNDYERKV